jgi:VCBS repeat-containing protein
MHKGCALGVVAGVLLVVGAATAQTVYVDVANTSGVENGTATYPYNTIQEGVNAATTGATVMVASGTYNAGVVISNRQGIIVRGSGAGTVVTNPVGIAFKIAKSRDITVRDLRIWGGTNNGFHITVATNIAIRGTTIERVSRNGYATDGGAIYAASSAVTFEGNTIKDNYGGQHGGAGRFFGCAIQLIDNLVQSNSAWNSSGGFYIDGYGYTSTPVVIRGNVFDYNRADYSGAVDFRGGIGSPVAIDHNVIRASGPSYQQAGAIRISSTYGTGAVTFVNNVVQDVWNPCCGGTRVGLYVTSTSSPVYVANNIFWSPSGFAAQGGAGNKVTAEYNNAYVAGFSGIATGAGNIAQNPLYANAAAGDFHLQGSSPCINAGNPDPAYNDNDGSRNDMGIYGGPIPGGVVHVDDSNTSGVEDGSETSPFNTIQEGVDAAVAGDTIQVAAGSYSGLVSVSNRASLTLDAEPGTVCQNATGYKFFIYGSTNITVRGFDINGGTDGIAVEYSTNVTLQANTLRSLYNTSSGGGIRGVWSSLTVRDSLIQSNYIAYTEPAGWFYNCNLQYVNNDVLNCEGGNAFIVGGGIHVANGDPARYDVSIRENVFRDVKAVYGPAMKLYGKGRLEVKNNIIEESGPWYRTDVSPDNGGMVDIYVWDSSTNEIVNNVFRNPRYHYYGSFQALHILDTSSTNGTLIIRNNIFQNDAPYTNYILTNAYAIYNESALVPVVDHNLVEGMSHYNVSPGTGSLDTNAFFVNAANGDFHLAAGSPAINAGHPASQYNDADGSRNDMGAYGGGVTNGGGGGGGSSNTAPVANSQSVSTPEDTAKAITLTATDAETNALTYSIVAGPAKGTLSGTAPNVTYTPYANTNGTDSFTFQAYDGALYSGVATVTVTITAVNDAPVANSQSVSTPEDASKAVTLTGSDIDSGSLTYSIVANPAKGGLTGTPPNVTYVPNPDVYGSDLFTFRAYDGALYSGVATVTVTITAVNDAPVAQNQGVTTTQNVAKAIVLSAIDVETNALTYSVVSSPANGSLSGSAPNLTYTPALNYVGADSFTFRASDGLATSAVASVAITVVAGGGSSLPQGSISNQTYDKVCAEVDNVNVPVRYSNATSYRITATHPLYAPASISNAGADFTNCTAFSTLIWQIGTYNLSDNEFLQTGFASGDIYYPQDAPAAGTDEAAGLLPREINSTTITNQYLHFTTDSEGGENNESKIGANLYVYMAQVSGTLQLKAMTWNGSAWVDRGNKTFTSTNMTQSWSIPDLTWLEGTDANRIQLRVVPASEGGVTTAGAYGRYDRMAMFKRSESGETVMGTNLLDNGNVVVKAIKIDFWWRATNAMAINVVGGKSTNGAHYLRIHKKIDGATSWPEVFVLYEDGNARFIPHVQSGVGSVPYASSFLLGPSVDGTRPSAPISSVTIDPRDLSLDITYKNGGTAHVELWVDRTKQVVDVSGITYNTTTQSFARLRSMWVTDGNADIDRVEGPAGAFPISRHWTGLVGNWWQFYRDVPSYHNTHAPDYRVEVMDSSAAFLSREAESFTTASNHTVMSRSNASGGQTIRMAAAPGQATYNLTVTGTYSDVYLRLRYAHSNGAAVVVTGKTVDVYLNGVLKDSTRAFNTGSDNSFEVMPSFYLGTVPSGTNQIRLVTKQSTYTLDLDKFDLVSQAVAPWTRNVIATQQAETPFSGSGYSIASRSNAVGGMTAALTAAGGSLTYNVSVVSAVSNAYIQVRYSDLQAPNAVNVFVDGVKAGKFPANATSNLNVFTSSPEVYIGGLAAGTRQIRIDTSAQTQGIEIDQFDVITYTNP